MMYVNSDLGVSLDAREVAAHMDQYDDLLGDAERAERCGCQSCRNLASTYRDLAVRHVELLVDLELVTA